jgi:hypothetical protein
MGIFRQLWASGKFVLKDKKQPECFQQNDALQQTEASSSESGISERSKAILGQLKPRRGQETGRWLREMGPRKENSELTSPAFNKADTIDDTVVWMDALFNEFCDLAYEFNKSAFGSDLLISSTRPTISERKSADEWYRTSTKTCQGRLTTKHWALILRGVNNKIDIFLLPSPMVLAFTAGQLDDSVYPPFADLTRSPDAESWSVGGEKIPFSAVPRFAKEILGDLIRVSSGVMAQSELFAQDDAPPVLGTNLAMGYDKSLAQADLYQLEPATIESGNPTMIMACDIVDQIVQCDLKQLYEEAAACSPSSNNANNIRIRISAIEAFRVKMIEAFEQYALITLPLASETFENSTVDDLMHS